MHATCIPEVQECVHPPPPEGLMHESIMTARFSPSKFKACYLCFDSVTISKDFLPSHYHIKEIYHDDLQADMPSVVYAREVTLAWIDPCTHIMRLVVTTIIFSKNIHREKIETSWFVVLHLHFTVNFYP